MSSKNLGKGLVIFIIIAMVFALGAVNLSTAQALPGSNDRAFSSVNEKVDVLIGFNQAPGFSERALVQAHGGEIYRQFSIVDVIAASMSEQQAAALQKNPAVSYIEPDGIVYTTGQSVPWGIDRVFGDESVSFETWNISTGTGIGVAVLDTGIDVNHEDLTVAGGRRFFMRGPFLRSDNNYNDVHGHGTHVAGTIAALDNEVGVVGIAPDVDLYAVKVLTDSGSGSVSAIVAGIEWVVERDDIQIINMSLGSSTYSQTFENACDAANDAGILVVSSAGNAGNDDGTGENVGYPAKYESVIAVAASDIVDNRGWFSSTGPEVELIAPGVKVESTVPGGYATYNGTSMASPHVAGTAALVWAANPDLTNVEIRNILAGTAEDLGLDEAHQGQGLVRADLAVKAAGEVEPPPPPEEYDLTVSSSAGGSVTKPGEGEFTYDEATVVDLIATAESDYQFVNWTGDTETIADVNAAETTITIEGDYSITANFEEKPEAVEYDLTISSSDGGSVTTPGEDTFTYDEGTVVDLVAKADSGYVFVKWTGDTGTIAEVNAASTTITMEGDYTITASFAESVAEGVVRVESITYSTRGGRLNDRHLDITLLLWDDQDEPVAGASVSATLNCDDGNSWDFAGTTGSGGTVTFTLNNYGSGCYETKVTAVEAEGLEWDGVTPKNEHCK